MFIKILTGLLLVTLSAFPQTKRALIIALDNYPDKMGWGTIHSSNDTLQLIPALITQKFNRANITVVGIKNGKKKELQDAIEKFIKSCHTDNIVFFHYSGHGQRVEDPSEDEADGYDEALAAADAASVYEPGVYTGDNHLTDDELHNYLRRIATAIGPNGDMLVTIDACFSGTGTRALGYSRGTDELMASRQYIDAHAHMALSSKPLLNEQDSTGLPYVAITATDAYSKDYEVTVNGINYGPLSYALGVVLNQLKDGETYGSLELKLKRQMALIGSSQVPVREGKPNKLVFNGKIVPDIRYFVSDTYLPPKKSFSLPFGNIHGLFDSTRMLIFDIGTNVDDHSKAWGRATIVKSKSGQCTARVDSAGSSPPSNIMKFIVIKAGHGNLSVGVKLDIADATLKNTFTNTFSDVAAIKTDAPSSSLWIESDNDYLQRRGMPATYVQLSNGKGDIIDSAIISSNKEEIAARFKKKITEFMYGDYLRKIQVDNNSLKGSLEIIMGACSVDSRRNILQTFTPYAEKDYKLPGGSIKAKAGDCFRLKINNSTKVKFYFAVLVVDPLNRVRQLIPERGKLAADLAIDPLGSGTVSYESPQRTQAYGFKPLKGKHVYKLILSKSPMDFSFLSDSGSRDPSLINKNILQALLLDAANGTRASTEMSDEIMITNVILDVQ